MGAASAIDGAIHIIGMRSKNLRIGHLPDKSKGEARHFLKRRLARMAVLGKIGKFFRDTLAALPRTPMQRRPGSSGRRFEGTEIGFASTLILRSHCDWTHAMAINAFTVVVFSDMHNLKVRE
jgi:hypothetical protein